MPEDLPYNEFLFADAFANLQEKYGFVPGADPSGGAGGGGGAPPGGGGGEGMPPGMGMGMPPGGGGGPGDPAGGGGGGGGPGGAPAGPDPLDQLMQRINQIEQRMVAGGGAGGPGAGGMLKPKIDVNVELMQIKNMLAKIVDHLGIPVPAQDMTATPEKLQQMAATQGQDPTGGMGGGAGAGGGTGAIGAMPGMDPMQGAGVPGAAGPAKAASAGYLGTYKPPGRPYDGAGVARMAEHADAIAIRWFRGEPAGAA